MKKTSWILILFMFLSLLSTSFAISEPSSWSINFINEIKSSNEIEVDRLMGNYQSNISRADFAYLAVKLYEYYTGVTTTVGSAAFKDTSDQYVLKAKNAGIVSGYPDGTYRPNNKIRRDELATLYVNLFKASGVSYIPASKLKFADDNIIATWAKESVYIARANSIVSGVGSNAFNPTGNATIEESLIMLYKGMTQIDKVSVIEKVLTTSEISKLVSPSVVYIELYDQNNKLIKMGSGFIISRDGKIVTNYHVIEGGYFAKVKLLDGRYYNVLSVLAYDIDRDIAILKMEASDLSEVTLGNSATINNGDNIITIGSPIGLENTISNGLISNTSRSFDGQNYIQISAPISSGSSGGVLLNYSGQVIGVTSAGFDAGQNLNLAIPINDVKTMINSIGSTNIAFGNHNTNVAVIEPPVAKSHLSYQEYQSYILTEYGHLNSGGYQTRFNEVVIDSTSTNDALYVFLYLDNSYFLPFLDIVSYNQNDIVLKIGGIASEISRYYNMDASVYIIYTDLYINYPSGFANNKIFEDTITYNSSTNNWFVFYPFLRVDKYIGYAIEHQWAF